MVLAKGVVFFYRFFFYVSFLSVCFSDGFEDEDVVIDDDE